MICWVCKRALPAWDTPPELTVAEREACDDCRPCLTATKETLDRAITEMNRSIAWHGPTDGEVH